MYSNFRYIQERTVHLNSRQKKSRRSVHYIVPFIESLTDRVLWRYRVRTARRDVL